MTPQLFKFKGQQVRTVSIEGEPYFVGKDVAKVLGYKYPADAVRNIVPEKFKGVEELSTPGGKQKSVVISEPGLYKLAFKSNKPEAEEFTNWVASEVLPAIRKHGAYMTDQRIKEALLDPDTVIQLATELKDERTGRLFAEQQVHELRPKATYYDKVLQSKGLVPITLIAKDYGMSGTSMNNLLHSLKIVYKMGGTWLLYSPYQSLGWTSSQTFVVDKPDGTQKTIMQTKWTQQGRLGLYELLKSKKNLVPVIERKGQE